MIENADINARVHLIEDGEEGVIGILHDFKINQMPVNFLTLVRIVLKPWVILQGR